MFSDVRFWLVLLLALCAAGAAPRRDPLARSIQLDPGFAYYTDRSQGSIASEVKVNGYRAVRLVVTRDSAADPELVKAFQEAGLAVWYMTFGNGVYSRADLPEGWESWKMKLKGGESGAVGYQYLCPNHPGYRKWKKEQSVKTLGRIGADGFEMAEPFFPVFGGPDKELYGCLCDHCRAAFLARYPEERGIPDFYDPKSPNHYTANRKRYEKWVEFRVQSVIDFHEEIVNSPGGVRERHPKAKVAVWGIADAIPDAVAKIREWEGIDAGRLAARVGPDLVVIQTDWPDWSNPSLPADYPLQYRTFVESVRSAGSKAPIVMQADIGSWEQCRRGADWIRACETAAKKAGMIGITAYEYHLGLDIYEAPPRLAAAAGSGDTVTLTFTKRLDAQIAADLSRYEADTGRIVRAEPDGNRVALTVEGHPSKITARDLADDPARRFFKNHPAVTMKKAETVRVRW
ncbi:MAG: N-acyl-D-glucosamine 2-epimerase [Armatimonadetes bacterium]|nr:N-acyl-D-glucosamine 2-epimerase [Armatimonadota bacterium]